MLRKVNMKHKFSYTKVIHIVETYQRISAVYEKIKLYHPVVPFVATVAISTHAASLMPNNSSTATSKAK